MAFFKNTQSDKVVKVLDAAENSGLITQLERHALEQYCDPVHCHMQGRGAIPGFSKTGENGLASFNLFSASIVQPAGLVGAPWDYSLEVHSNMNAVVYGNSSHNANVILTNGPPNYAAGGITCNAALTATGGVSWSTLAATTFPVTSFFTGGQWALNYQAPTLSRARGRPVALAIKIEDTTNVLNQAGIVHTCRLPEVDSSETTVMFSAIAANTGSYLCKQQFLSPTSPAAMAIMPGYMTHLAKDGVYSVILIDQNQDACCQDYTAPVYPIDPANQITNVFFPILSTVSSTGTFQQPFKNSGIVPQIFYFSGLPASYSATVTISLVYDLKPHPSVPAQASLIPYMVQSPAYVPFVEAMCQLILRSAPAMGFAKDNDAWTWLKETFGSLASGLGPIISMLPHPVAKALGAGLTGFGGLATPKTQKQIKSDVKKKVQRAAPMPMPSPSVNDRQPRAPKVPSRTSANYSNQRAALKRDIVLDKRALKNARSRRIGQGGPAGGQAARKRRARTRSF